mmetsp:Transcript_36146/g.90711  ORF Transcript_36146/g.90711 Transcript_36146/m.90711 type:complete len:890 (-) Transcript_36146:201-2870(-)|eukprot:CAMPEP_0177641276 /NCGR_PEP_ID=MMETSP0447-20121125/6979_1 /TAXON_ID=0 /ORGANISM="Stygamoeba regulata, Strain BSH-02190019" /LENGTH=889 /DNA_ID=CAMNT_0019143381 /DNA_START=155 /DNA_END=2824 /DNA_ORIENTATION=+
MQQRKQKACLTGSSGVVERSEISDYCLSNYQVLKKESKINSFSGMISRLHSHGIRNFTDLLAVSDDAWSQLGVPIGVRNFLQDAAQKMVDAGPFPQAVGSRQLWWDELGVKRFDVFTSDNGVATIKIPYLVHLFVQEEDYDLIKWCLAEWAHVLSSKSEKREIIFEEQFVEDLWDQSVTYLQSQQDKLTSKLSEYEGKVKSLMKKRDELPLAECPTAPPPLDAWIGLWYTSLIEAHEEELWDTYFQEDLDEGGYATWAISLVDQLDGGADQSSFASDYTFSSLLKPMKECLGDSCAKYADVLKADLSKKFDYFQKMTAYTDYTYKVSNLETDIKKYQAYVANFPSAQNLSPLYANQFVASKLVLFYGLDDEFVDASKPNVLRTSRVTQRGLNDAQSTGMGGTKTEKAEKKPKAGKVAKKKEEAGWPCTLFKQILEEGRFCEVASLLLASDDQLKGALGKVDGDTVAKLKTCLVVPTDDAYVRELVKDVQDDPSKHPNVGDGTKTFVASTKRDGSSPTAISNREGTDSGGFTTVGLCSLVSYKGGQQFYRVDDTQYVKMECGLPEFKQCLKIAQKDKKYSKFLEKANEFVNNINPKNTVLPFIMVGHLCDTLSRADKIRTIMHEIGHMLGLAHTFLDQLRTNDGRYEEIYGLTTHQKSVSFCGKYRNRHTQWVDFGSIMNYSPDVVAIKEEYVDRLVDARDKILGKNCLPSKYDAIFLIKELFGVDTTTVPMTALDTSDEECFLPYNESNGFKRPGDEARIKIDDIIAASRTKRMEIGSREIGKPPAPTAVDDCKLLMLRFSVVIRPDLSQAANASRKLEYELSKETVDSKVVADNVAVVVDKFRGALWALKALLVKVDAVGPALEPPRHGCGCGPQKPTKAPQPTGKNP